MGFNVQVGWLELEFVGQRLVLGGVVCCMETPDLSEIAVNAFAADKFGNIFQRLLAFAQDAQCQLLAVPFGQLVKAGLDAGGDLAAIARAAAPAGFLGVYHQGRASATGGLQGGMQAGVAGANHQHVNRGWQRQVGQGRAGCVIPPVGLGFALDHQFFMGHAVALRDTTSTKSASFLANRMVGTLVLPKVSVGCIGPF